MFKFIGVFLGLAVCLFCAVKFLVIPTFPIVAAKVPVLATPFGALGLSGCIMIGLLFTKK